MRRRDFIKVVAGSASFWPLSTRAQPVGSMRLIGVLMAWPESDTHAQSWLAAFRSALAKLGWMEGNNLRIELLWSAANADRTTTLAKELVDLRPDAIFGQTTPVHESAFGTKRASQLHRLPPLPGIDRIWE